MKVLLNFKNKFNKKNSNKLGGVEVLNFNLYNNLKKRGYKIYTINDYKKKNFYDAIISSNDARIFNTVNANKKILWLHNKLQIEKSIRKKQFLSIMKNEIYSVFVSKYLENITTRLYNFKSRVVIPNFLDKKFENLKINFNRKPIVIWSVQRDKGLSNTIKTWVEKVYSKNNNAELHIFAVNKFANKDMFRKYNIFFHGRVDKKTLIKYYSKASCMICLGYDETFCLNAIEAFACGTPVLSFKKTALNHLIVNNVNGFKVDNFTQIANKINKLINLNKKQRKKIIMSTNKFSTKYYFKKIENKWINLLKL